MSIETEITRIKTNIANAYTKAEEKGATLPEVQNSDNLPSTIESITGGGDEWQPQPDWWDIDKILEEDTEEYPAKAIMLLRDTSDTMTIFKDSFTNLSKIKLSDGMVYTTFSNDIIHSWNTTNDKECSLGYKTRYAIFYFSTTVTVLPNNDTTTWLKNFGSITLYAIFKDLQITTWNTGRSYNGLRICESLKFLNSGINIVEILQPCFKNVYFDENSRWTNPNTAFGGKFYGAKNLTSNAIQNLYNFIYTQENTNCSRLFYDCQKLKEINLINTNNVTNFSQTFANCYDLKIVKNINTNKSTNLTSFFNNCFSLESLENCNLDFQNAITLDGMFYFCYLLKEINFKNFTDKVTAINGMFTNCFSLKRIGILNTLNTANFNQAFSGCYSLNTIEYINFNSATNVVNTFLNCHALENINVENIKISGLDFSSCNNLSHDSLINIRNACADYSDGDTHTIKIGTTNLAKLTEDEIAEWQNKGWTIS